MRPGKPCGRIRRRLDAFLENRLSPEERSQVREHLEVCPACREFQEEWLRLNASLAAVLSTEPAPPGFADAVMRAVRQEAASPRKQDWTWLDLAVRWVTGGALGAILGLAGWLGMTEAGSENWKTLAGERLVSAEQSLAARADLAVAAAKQEWFDLLLLPEKWWNGLLEIAAWWDHPAVPAAGLFALAGLAAWMVQWTRSGETAR